MATAHILFATLKFKNCRNMKTYINQIIKLCFLVLCISVNAQRYPVQVTQTVLPPYSSKLSDYTTATNVKLRLDVLLTDVVASNRQVRLKLRIKGNGLNIQSRDVVSGAPQIFLNGGVLQQLTNLDLGAYFQLNNLVGINPEQYNKPLPEGMYSICWEVYDVITNQQINNPATGCSDIFLILNDPPFLNLPFKGDQLVAKDPMNIIFQWTPRHVNATNVSYDFELREIWDRNIDPQSAFLASPNYYTETVNTTTLLYDISKPVLLPKKLYAWRVKAKSITGISENSVFKNDGYSEIYYFTYTNRCDAPSFILSEALNSSGVKITWQGSFDHKKYHVQYKREDIPDAEWFDVYTYNNQAQISNLKQGETYVFRVGGTCNELNDFQQAYTYSSISQFTMPRKDEVATYNCGIIPEIEIKNLEPLKNIGVNESFTAGDFPITVKQVQGGNGVFTGTGFIVVPYLADTKIAVTFSSVKINEDYQLTDGVIRTTYDPTWGGVSDVNDVFVSGDGNLPSNTVDFVIEDIQVDPNGDIIVIGTNGEIVELPGGEGQVITDANGQTWTVDAEGNVTETGEAAEGGASNSENTNGVNNQGEATAITAKGIVVTFENADDSKYGFDTYEKSDKVTKDLYKKLNDDYFIPYKAVAHGATERIIAKLDITDAKIKPSDIVFKTKDGIALTKVDSTATSYTFELKGTLTDNSVETQAVIKQGDKYEIAGAFIQYQAKIKEVDIVLVNTSNSNTSKIKETLQRIYQQALVQLNIKEINDFTNDLERLVSDDTIESGESEFLSQYTAQQKAINGALKVRNDFNKKAYYLILTNKKPSKEGEEGFMPLGKQFGYLFMSSGANERTIAHELGHGTFQLKHPFSSKSYGYEEKATSWLLDYGKGEKIPYVHWKEIHNPKLRLGIFDKDEEGEHYARPGLFSSLKFGANSDKTFTFITPSGQYIVLPNEVADVSRFYGYYGTSGEMNKTKFNQFLNIVPGTLRKFTIDKRVFTAKFETSDDSTILTGYFDEKGRAYNSKDFGIDLEKTYAENKKSILYALGKKDNTLSYYVYCLNGEKVALKPYQEQSLVTDITEFPVQSISSNLINDVKKVKFATKGGQQSITAESIKWAFTKYNSTEDQILRNKMAELKSLYPRFMQEITRRYADWNDEGKVCIGSLSSNFDSYIRDLFCDKTQSSVPTSTPGLNSTITNYSRNSTKLPANSFEWQKLFYNYVKDNLFKLREELSASILAYNANPDLIDEHNRGKIARVSNLAAKDDIKQLRSDVIIQLLSKIVHNGLVTEGSVPASDFEGAILNLLKKADKKNYKEILTGLEGRNYYSEKEEKSFLFKELYDGIHDFGTESKNALKLVSILTEMTLKSGDFYEQRSIETNNDLGERTFVLDYNNFVVATGKSILYGNVFFQIADEASNNYLENSLETYDISYDWLKDENKISLEQFQEVGFIPTNSSKPKKLRPFDLINFINVSNLSGVKDLDRSVQGIQQRAKLTDVPLPVIVAMYGSDKAGQETIEQGISTTIDVASLLASGGAITAIKGLSSVNKMRKAFYMLDVASSGLSLTATAISDSEENRKYREVLNALSAVTGLVSMGDAGIDVYDKIKKASTLSKRIEIAKNSVDLVKNLPEKKVVETVFETFNKLDEDELVKFLNKYPGQLENAVKITIKYLKDAVKTNKANKVDEAKKLLTTLGKAIAKNKSGFITRLGNNPKLASLKKELEILEAEEAGIIEKFAVDFKYLTDDGLEEFANDLDLITGWRVLHKLEAERAVKTDIDELTSVSEIIERGGGYKAWKASEAGKSDRLWNSIAINEGTGNKIELELFGGEKFNVGFITVDKDVIGFDINLAAHLQKQGLGTKIVEEAVKTFNPKRIEVSWAVDPKAYENGAALSYNKYRELEKTISDKHEVALATPGGRVMKKFGYDKVVELKDNGKNIYVLFETSRSIFQEVHTVLKNVKGRAGEFIVKHDLSDKELCSGWFVDGITTKEVEFALQTVFDDVRYASGKKVRQAVLDEMSNGDLNTIDAIRSEWISGAGLETNMKAFQEAIDEGLSIEEAIFRTKAGQWNKELGFDKVEVLDKSVTSSNQYRSIKLRFVRSTSKASHVPVNEVRKKVKNVSQHILGIAHSKGNFKKASVTVHGKKFDLEGFKGPHTEKALKDYVERNGGSYAIEKIEVDENGVFKGVPILYAHDKEFVKVTGNNFKYHKGVGNTKVGGESSFFPVDMTNEEILENVIHAVNNNKGYVKSADGTLSSDLLYGFSKDGKIEIRFKLKPDGTIGTYYPVIKKGKLEKLPSIRSFVHSNDVKNILKGILEANEGAFPKNIDLLGYKLGTKDDGIIDIIVHSNDKGEFLMNVEGKTKVASAFILAKVIEELPDGQKIRLLSCNSEEVAIKISELTNKEFYASHGSVKLYEDGTIVHETPFKKYHKGARSEIDEIPPNTKEGTGDYIELGLFGGEKTLKEQVEAATLYFNPWSYHDLIRKLYADASMKQDYEALSKMFGIYKDFKNKNIGKTNKDYSKDFQPWPNKLKGSDDRVKYLKTAEERKPYEVSVKNGVLYTDGKELSKTKGFLDGEIIFIMDKDGSIYAGIGRPGFFHHSSFLDGGDIITGGEFRFINKKTLEIRPKSGHYSPSLDSLKAVIEELASRGFDIRNMKINPDVR